MKTDRELLGLAAKAAGMTGYRHCEAWNSMNRYTMQDGYFGPNWNPLTDDGDALRLAVKLQMLIEINLGCVIAYAERKDGSVQDPEYVYFDKLETGMEHGDRLAATRRAIIRAAAEIGASL